MNPIFTSEDIALLLRLLTAHLLTDFVLQPGSWVNEKKLNHAKSISLYKHTLITAFVAYLFLAQWANWQIPLIIFITHTLIDIWKSYQVERVRYFIADQAMHTVVILFCWIWITSGFDVCFTPVEFVLIKPSFWVYIFAYLVTIYPLGFLIGMMVKKFKVQLKNENSNQSSTAVNDETLADAGRWIGIFERMLIITFVLNGQFGAIGFLIAAKSILRFNNKDEDRARKETEYVLVGTLISYTFSILIGLIASWLINNL
ncbi:MAG: DUF3307 domain-containing protein [Bacteroidia bacterium]